MFDSHRPVCTTVHGATWLLAIGKCACRVNVMFIVLFMGAVILIVCHCDDVSVVYLFLQKRRFNFTYGLLLSCVFLHYVLDAQLLLQPQAADNKRH